MLDNEILRVKITGEYCLFYPTRFKGRTNDLPLYDPLGCQRDT
jgi:hypothetical protein